MNYLIDMILKLAKVDRRWIFLIIGLVVLIPLIYPLSLPVSPKEGQFLSVNNPYESGIYLQKSLQNFDFGLSSCLATCVICQSLSFE